MYIRHTPDRALLVGDDPDTDSIHDVIPEDGDFNHYVIPVKVVDDPAEIRRLLSGECSAETPDMPVLLMTWGAE